MQSFDEIVFVFFMRKTAYAIGQCVEVRVVLFFYQAEDGIRDWSVTGVQTCALPISGSPPNAIATGMVSPRSAITRQCAAPTLCRCQCMAREFFPSTCTRYIPTFRTPDPDRKSVV